MYARRMLIGAALLLAACAAEETGISNSTLRSRITSNQTTQAEVVNLFGQPTRQEGPVWTYISKREMVSAGGGGFQRSFVQEDQLVLRFNGQTVQSSDFTKGELKAVP